MRTLKDMQIDERYERAAQGVPPAFESVVCGIDAGRASQEAARQAAVLAGPGGTVVYVCVEWSEGVGLGAKATIRRERATEALEAAVDAGREAGADASSHLAVSRDVTAELIRQARDADLLVVGSHSHSRAGGIAIGHVGSRLLHEAPLPVVVCRRPPQESPFPKDLLVATDGSEGSAEATRLAARIAHRHGSHVTQLHVNDSVDAPRHKMGIEAAQLMEATGSEPVVATETGKPHERIAARAAQQGVSLVALGSRGLHGLRALGSVSERVAHEAPCSVLVARPRE